VRLKAVIEPRMRIHPAPHIEPRQTVHPAPRVEQPAPATPPSEPTSTDGSKPRIPPLQPPWKQLPWKAPPAAIIRLKQVLRPPDVHARGSILDVFV